ncbi:VTT domain-containing protein [Cupriavidus plantarum]|uniref:Phosphatidylserine/phosphatidylglycerophosphate/ cardiolipin synthase-like enzyme n=1 Tax=Cupriavidus plantarum TaxID=942865 RepID=A0A316ERA3_9BURK|nr:VTT domain-containing protein [Cupriavidus plantarum]PWK35017.1 phosphatidylserine/phosphatidylglycerophosphate/cardiolipin synthase-like enzyme [Cupriavidus plantarum]
MRTAPAPILKPGHNCWRQEHSDRFAMLVDGEAYFSALREALLHARHTVFILGWDIDSRMELEPGGSNDGYPAALKDFLNELARRRPGLRVYVLSWDFSMVFALEREWLPAAQAHWQAHRRLSFQLDGNHPPGASHHQKVVVIDHQVAFAGGLDLTIRRWDRHHHMADDPLRKDPDGKPYAPFHDVQCVFDGDAAAAMGDLAAERWRNATGRRPRTPGEADRRLEDAWPLSVTPDITDVRLGISRTEPPRDDSPGVSEIRALHLDAIAAAKDNLYLENQYFSSTLIADALGERLQEAGGPDIALVSRRVESGWLEEHSMGVLRARLYRKLRAADTDGRFALFCPQVPGLGDDCVNVHSKVMVVDDTLLTIGSANLSNRSFGLDTECNIVLEAAGDARIATAIRAMRDRLLCEHLAVTPREFDLAFSQTGRLLATCALLHRPEGRTLEPFAPEVPEDIDAVSPSADLLDPIEPIDSEHVVEQFVSHEARPRVVGRVGMLVLLLVVLAGLAFAWRYTPLREWADFRAVLALVQRVDDMPLAPLAMMAAYVIGGLVLMPVTVLIVVTVVVFGPLYGGALALCGTVLSAATGYGIGRMLGRNAVRRFGGNRLNRLSQQVGEHGILAMVVMRLVPVAPFTLVNLVVGASRIRLRDCLLGTMIGMTPGILISASLVDRIAAAARNPGPLTFALVLAVLLLPASVLLLLRRRKRRREAHARAAGTSDRSKRHRPPTPPSTRQRMGSV